MVAYFLQACEVALWASPDQDMGHQCISTYITAPAATAAATTTAATAINTDISTDDDILSFLDDAVLAAPNGSSNNLIVGASFDEGYEGRLQATKSTASRKMLKAYQDL